MLADTAKFHGKRISVVSEKVTPIELLESWNKAVGLDAKFRQLSTKEFTDRLLNLHHFPKVFAVTLAENLSLYRDAPEDWTKGGDFDIQDLVPDLMTWDKYVK